MDPELVTVTVDRASQVFTSGAQPEADVCCLHTTEGMSWPGYSGGGAAPHATIRALPGVGISVREHIPVTQYAKALMNLPGGVETNRRGVLQYELVGTCDPKHKGDPAWFYWPDADDVVLEALAEYLRPILARFAIPLVGAELLPYPASYGPSRVRFSFAEWLAFQGLCGHLNVPENDHGDPGAFPMARLLTFLTRTHTAAPDPMEELMAAQVKNPLTGKLWDADDALWSMWSYIIQTRQAVADLGRKLGVTVDVDESAIANQLAATLGPQLTQALTAAQAEGGTPEQIAERVVALLGQRITDGGKA